MAEPLSKGRVLVVGANAALSYPCIGFLLQGGYSLHLTCRTLEKAEAVRDRLLRDCAGNKAWSLENRISCSALKLPAALEDVKALLTDLSEGEQVFAGIFIAAGMYAQTGDLTADGEQGLKRELELLAVNFNALIPLIALAAKMLKPLPKQSAWKKKGSGRPFIAVISSVAGVRGRASNYAYGASKAALSTYLSGLRQSHSDLCIIDLRPGLIESPMLDGRTLPKALIAKPDSMVSGLAKGLKHPRGGIFYVPGWWRLVMGLAALLPERLYQRLKL